MSAEPPSGVTSVFVDEHLIALDKPAGLLAVPGRGADKADCLSTRVQASYPEALIVHRLDQATSGLLLMARNLAMQRALGRAFEQREVHKRYIAVAAGRLGLGPGDAGEIDLPLIADWPRRPLQKVDQAAGKPALTRWQVLAHDHAGGLAVAARISCVYIWPPSDTPCWATPCTRRPRSVVQRRACCCMPSGSCCFIPPVAPSWTCWCRRPSRASRDCTPQVTKRTTRRGAA